MDLRRGTVRLTRLAVALVIVLVTPVVATGIVLATQLFVPLPAVLPEPEELEAVRFSQVYDANGQLIHTYQRFDQSIPVAPGDIPDVVEQAVIAAEDRNFYSHDGVDVRGTVRALVTDVQEGSFSQGGSTITQQLAKNAYGAGKERTITRKVREAVLAAQLDRSLSKDQILYEYLSIVYFGEGAYGIGAAAAVYFGKPVNQLDLSEAATLAAVIPAPSRYNPRADIATAEQRRRRILDIMREEGMITPEAWTEAANRPLWLESGGPAPGPHTLVVNRPTTETRYPWFIQYVTEYLTEQLGSEDALYRGGLQIYTTLDQRVQAEAEATVAETVAGAAVQTSTDPQTGAPVEHQLQMSLTAVEPPTGFVRAMVGGRDFAVDQTNLATGAGTFRGRGRQTGSSFKPFVLAEAFEQGITPNEVYSGGPLTIGDYSPENYEGAGYGNLSLRTATVKSVNTVFVRLMQDVGPEQVVALANRVGVQIPSIDPAVDGTGLSIALGSREVPTLEMAAGYGVFANSGVRVPPTPVVRVFDPAGKLVLDRSSPQGEQALQPATADNVTDVLRGVLTEGTAAGKGIGRPAAGKTGTAQDFKDAWFVGYTPTLSTAVFMGYDPPPPVGRRFSVKGRNLTGGSFPASAWQRFMRAALEGVPITDFSEPAPIQEPASEATQRERRGFAPKDRDERGRVDAGGPYVVQAEAPRPPMPTSTTSSTTSTTSPTSTTSTTRRPSPFGDSDDDETDGF